MTTTRIPFIDRESEIDLINKLIHESGTRRVLWIQGPGGSGKTRLLEEIRERFGKDLGEKYSLANIIDFDDRSFHVYENLERCIAQQLGERSYKEYLQAVLDRIKMEGAEVSSETLNRQIDHVTEILIDHFNKISRECRPIWMFDTVEKVDERVWEHLCNVIGRATNAFFLLVSRPNEPLWKSLKASLGDDAQMILWKPLEDSEFAKRYIDKKKQALHIPLPPQFSEKIIQLVGARPILIDLTVEAVSRNRIPKLLENLSLEEIEKFKSQKDNHLQQDFEVQLVQEVMEIRDMMDRLILVMSRVYPMSDQMIARFLHVDETAAKTLFDEAKSQTVVKVLPDGRITLHDEVRAMVKEHVWPQIDPDQDRQKRDSTLAVQYFTQKEKELIEEIQKYELAQNVEEEIGSPETIMGSLAHSETNKQEIWDVREQLLFHSLFCDLADGVGSFARIFDDATRAYQFPYRDVLLKEIALYYDTLPPALKYEVDSRKVKAFLDRGEYISADQLSRNILKVKTLTPEQRVDMLIQAGNIKIRLGCLVEGEEDFNKAVIICEREKLQKSLVPALNARGWGSRLIGNMEKAIKDYQRAFELSIITGDKLRRAWILNNLAFVHSEQGRFNVALALCTQARELWDELDFGRGLGALYEVYGLHYVRTQQYEQAIESFELALGKFKARDIEWQSRIHSDLGLTYRIMGDYKTAMHELNIAEKCGIKKDQAMILHRKAHVQLELGKVPEAKSLFEDSYKESKNISDPLLELNNLGDLAEISLLEKDYSSLSKFEDMFREYKRSWPEMTYARVEGMILKHLGDLTLGLDCTNSASAISYYRDAFTLLAKYETYLKYTVQTQLKALQTYLKELKAPPQTLAELGKALYDNWQKNGLAALHPEALSFFVSWMEAGK